MIQAACSAGTGGVLLPKVVDGTLRLPSQPASRPGCSLKIPPTQESEITLPSSAAACLPPPPGSSKCSDDHAANYPCDLQAPLCSSSLQAGPSFSG